MNSLFSVLHKQTIKKTVSEINNNRTKRSGNISQQDKRYLVCTSTFLGFMFSVDIKASVFKKRLERALCEHLKHINQAGKAEGRICVPL